MKGRKAAFPRNLLKMPQTLYASLPRYQYYVVPAIQFSYQSQMPQVDLQPPKPPEPEPENLPTVDFGGSGNAVAEDIVKTPAPPTVEDAPDDDAGTY